MNFRNYLDEQRTSFSALERAYQVSKEAAKAAKLKGMQPCLISSESGPPQLASRYKVITIPQGFAPIVETEEVASLQILCITTLPCRTHIYPAIV